MKYAHVGGERREAQPGVSGECPACHAAMVARCGEVRVWHWAHRGRRTCDHWWETETEWHRAWKDEFPVEWQEVVGRAEDGERHIADVKTEHGLVIEFQHSYLRPEERRAREAFYGRMVWVVDGLRRKRDKSQLSEALKSGRVVRREPLMVTAFSDECALLREWAGSRVPVLFDFGGPVLWHLNPEGPNGRALLVRVPRKDFVDGLRTGRGYKGMAVQIKKAAVSPRRPLSTYEQNSILEHMAQAASRRHHGKARRPLSFQQYLARKRRARSRVRF